MVRLDKDLWRFGDAGETRRLSWREAAAIQTFPKDIEFTGNLISKYKQIGNAVPVKLAEYVATQLKQILTMEEVKKIWVQESRPKTEKLLSMHVS